MPRDLETPQVQKKQATRPRWERPALIALLVVTGVLYIWGLGASGWANSFYSAAVQAGSESWKAFFYGSSDAANAITVDKPPAALWIMALSVRIFGLSGWSILVPQALMGVASVGVLYATVRRWFSPSAALLSGLALALTPVATLMFRFNNPDALLTLLMTIGAYATVRAVEKGSTRWLVLVGVLVGFGFLTKMLQALLVVPVFALVYLIAGQPRLRRRIGQLLLAGLAMVLSAGWWIAIVELVPAQYRPYIGGSQNNSILELTLGYNGLGRLTGDETGSVGGGDGQGNGMWGETGLTRLFDAEIGGQISWLIPAVLLFFAVMLWLTRRLPRTDKTRAAFVLWGGWLLVTGLVFSLMQGIFHAYYTVALAPAVAALAGLGAALLWRQREHLVASVTLAVGLALTSVWSYVLLTRSSDFLPWLRYVVLVAGLGAAVGLLVMTFLPAPAKAVAGKLVATVAVLAALAGPAAYSIDTASTAEAGSIVSAGPAVAGAMGGPGGGFRGGPPPGMTGQNGQTNQNSQTQNGQTQNGFPQVPGQAQGQQNQGQQNQSQQGPGQDGGMGGLLGGSQVSDEMVALLQENASSYTWVAAAVGSNNASSYQLESGYPVMAIGGFNGSDPAPTLAQFKQYVAAGKIHYFIGGGGFGGQSMGGSSESSEIASWVQANFESTTVGNVTVYDLSGGATDA
ncbi:glycosyltransferase family 39 protein [Flindersiella endophytica]